MPGELATPSPYNLPAIVFNPPPPPKLPLPIVDTSKLSKAKAIADMAQALSQLPTEMLNNYVKGRAIKTQGLAQDALNQRLESGNLEGMQLTSGPRGTTATLGSTTVVDPTVATARRDAAVANADAAKSRAAAAASGPAKYQSIVASIQGGATSAPAAGITPTESDLENFATGETGDETVDDTASTFGTMPLIGEEQPVDENAAEGLDPIEPGGETNLAAMADKAPVVVGAPANDNDPAGPLPTKTAAPAVKAAPTAPSLPKQFIHPTTKEAYVLQPNGDYEVTNDRGVSRIVRMPKPKVADGDGKTYANVEAAKADGVDPTGAIFHDDGSLTVKKYRAGGVDTKGKGVMTDAQKRALQSAANLTIDMKDLEAKQKDLFSQNKAGPVMGRIENWKLQAGYGDAAYVEANGNIDISQFRIARLLNGPGVLTDKDIARAQRVAPTLNETPQSFAAKMRAVRRSLRTDIENWKLLNEGQATTQQTALADKAIESLNEEEAAVSGKTPASKPAAPAAAAPASSAPAITGPGATKETAILVNNMEEFEKAPVGAWVKDPAGNTRRKLK